MKEKLYRFRLPIIIIAVVIVMVVVSICLRTFSGGGGGKGETSEYFEGSQYPVTAEVNENGDVLISLDGSATPDLSWAAVNETMDLCEVKAKSKEKNGIISVLIKPLAPGYASVVFSRERTIDDESYVVARIHVEVIIVKEDDGTLKSEISDIYLDSSSAGAVETANPFVIEGTRVIMPKGGDWEVIETTAEGGASAGVYGIYHGRDDDGKDFIDVFPAVNDRVFELALSEDFSSLETPEDADNPIGNVRKARLMIKSESLGLSYIYTYRVNENGYGELKPTGETIELKPVEEVEETPEASGEGVEENGGN